MNKVIISGNLVKDVELKQGESNGKTFNACNFSVAVPRKYKTETGERPADFIDCTAYNKTAETIVKFFHKGDRILIEGSITNKKYKDKDGREVLKNIVLVTDFDFGTKKNVSPEEYANENNGMLKENGEWQNVPDTN